MVAKEIISQQYQRPSEPLLQVFLSAVNNKELIQVASTGSLVAQSSKFCFKHRHFISKTLSHHYRNNRAMLRQKFRKSVRMQP